ncbi:hypothetical protein [Streptomyces viridosporus]
MGTAPGTRSHGYGREVRPGSTVVDPAPFHERNDPWRTGAAGETPGFRRA